ncbi:MAG TPA: hypothetical protein VEA79_03320 [Phenylobacterium sp.]|nr:hypothetical protein [Phenylobacterium sp.]
MALQFVWLCAVAAAMLHFDAADLWPLYQGNPAQLAAGAMFMVVMFFLVSGYLLSWILAYVIFLIFRDLGWALLGVLLAAMLIAHLFVLKSWIGRKLGDSIIVGAIFGAAGSFVIPLVVSGVGGRASQRIGAL